jgi:hypothetical protein
MAATRQCANRRGWTAGRQQCSIGLADQSLVTERGSITAGKAVHWRCAAQTIRRRFKEGASSISVRRTYRRIPTPEAAHVRRAGPEVPILLFVGAWILVLSWDTPGAVGLISPALFAWVAGAVALLRAIRRAPATAWKASQVAPADKRVIRWLWIGAHCSS